MKQSLILLFFASMPFLATAGLFRIPEDSRNYGTLPESLYDEADVLFNTLESTVNRELPNVSSAGDLVKNVSNASVLSGTGSGTDYASPFDLAIVGFQSGIGVDLGTTKLSKLSEEPEKTAGFAPQFAIMAGVNLQMIPIPVFNKTKFYVHYFSKTFKQDELSLKSRALGFHFQYKVMDSRDLLRLVRWHGVDLTTGYRRNTLKGGTDIELNKSVRQNVPGIGDTTLSFNGMANIDFDMATNSIPLEASSAIRFLYSLFFYGGGGIDLSLGKSRASGALSNSTISASGATDISAEAKFQVAEEKKPQILSAKYFVGAGIELGVLSLYGQWHQSLTNDTLGFALGVKGFW